MDGAVVVRRAGAEDAQAVAAIAQAAYARYVPRIKPAPGPLSANYAAHVADDEVWVAETDGTIVGFVILMPDRDALLLDNIAVLPSAQGRGIGRTLMRLAEERALDSGLASVRLYTNAGMTANLAMYANHGYVETARDTDSAGRPRVWLRKDLAAET